MEKAHIIKIGNSQGIRIPKPLLKQAGLTDDVELEAQQDRIIIHSVRRPRHGWDKQFATMAKHEDDSLFDVNVPSFTNWDGDEWEW